MGLDYFLACLKLTVKLPKGVMIWGCTAASRLGCKLPTKYSKTICFPVFQIQMLVQITYFSRIEQLVF